MRASEIFKDTATISKERAIECIIDHLTWGESVPYVSGGNGGSGAGDLMGYSERQKEELKSELEAADFDNNPVEIASDFDKVLLDPTDYKYCVRFSDANGGWTQFLLWD